LTAGETLSRSIGHFQEVAAAPLLTKRPESSKSKLFASPNGFRAKDLLVNNQVFETLWQRTFSRISALSLFARHGKRSLNHHHEDYAALVPSANPTHTPPVDAITDAGTLEQTQELGFYFHSHLWIALFLWTVKAAAYLRRSSSLCCRCGVITKLSESFLVLALAVRHRRAFI
jgi:hypothetical protein